MLARDEQIVKQLPRRCRYIHRFTSSEPIQTLFILQSTKDVRFLRGVLSATIAKLGSLRSSVGCALCPASRGVFTAREVPASRVRRRAARHLGRRHSHRCNIDGPSRQVANGWRAPNLQMGTPPGGRSHLYQFGGRQAAWRRPRALFTASVHGGGGAAIARTVCRRFSRPVPTRR